MAYTTEELLLAHHVRDRANAIRQVALDAALEASNADRYPAFSFEPDSHDSHEASRIEERQLRKEWEKGFDGFKAKKAEFASDWRRQHPVTEFVPEAYRLLLEVADVMAALRK